MRFSFISGLMILSTITGCALPPGLGPSESSHQVYSLDGVKLISPDYPNGNHPDTYLQAEYEVAPTRRLLLRYESFGEQVGNVDLGRDKTVSLEIAMADAQQRDEATAALELCPVTQNWMMLASWHVPFYGPGGRWREPGGDYDEPGCVQAEKNDATKEAVSPDRVLVFDVTRWFVDYARGRQTDYGLILLSKEPIRIVGDLSGSFSPRLRFNKF